jgi:hypothetical protein
VFLLMLVTFGIGAASGVVNSFEGHPMGPSIPKQSGVRVSQDVSKSCTKSRLVHSSPLCA